MRSAARQLSDRQAEAAARDQKSAIDQLEKIWEAVIPFHALLARDLAEQTTIARTLEPASSPDTKPEGDEPSRKKDARRDEPQPASPGRSAGDGHESLGTESEDLARLEVFQERTLRRTQLLKLKAEAELARLDKPQPSGAEQKGHEPSSGKDAAKNAAPGQPKPVDPEQIKAGYQQAIKLAPQAVDQMQRAVKALRQKQRQTAHPPAEEARKTLEEIQKAQPKNDQQDQQQEDQKKKNEEQQKQDQKDQQKEEQQKQDQRKDDAEKKDQQKKDQEPKKQEERKKSDEQKQVRKEDQKRPQPQVSPDRIEELLRNVRERQQEKRDRDRKMKAGILGRMPVEKDW
jgi:hypothetical protein